MYEGFRFNGALGYAITEVLFLVDVVGNYNRGQLYSMLSL
jgi:hypothetical protein